MGRRAAAAPTACPLAPCSCRGPFGTGRGGAGGPPALARARARPALRRGLSWIALLPSPALAALTRGRTAPAHFCVLRRVHGDWTRLAWCAGGAQPRESRRGRRARGSCASMRTLGAGHAPQLGEGVGLRLRSVVDETSSAGLRLVASVVGEASSFSHVVCAAARRSMRRRRTPNAGVFVLAEDRAVRNAAAGHSWAWAVRASLVRDRIMVVRVTVLVEAQLPHAARHGGVAPRLR